MRKIKMVTRTIATTTAEIMTVDVKNGTIDSREFQLTGRRNEEEILTAAKKAFDTSDIKAVHVKSFEYEEALYGMDEEFFLKFARKLPPRGTSEEE